MNNTVGAAVAVATAIIGLATLAVILSRNSQAPAVITAVGSAFGSAIREAVSPLTIGNASQISG